VINDHKFEQKGAYNLRQNGTSICHGDSEHIKIKRKTDKPGIDIYIDGETKGEAVYIPVVVSVSGMTDVVYNDFYVADGADVSIIAGCGIHNPGEDSSRHDGIHSFYVGENSRVKYIEKHYGDGDGNGERIMNPETVVEMDKNSYMEMETVQIKGVDSTVRLTKAKLAQGARLVVMERLMTHGNQTAESHFEVVLEGEDSAANVVSRSVARDHSYQKFVSNIVGNTVCSGHTECDAIIMDQAKVVAVPELSANSTDAALIHEAAIGKIAGEQIIKLMTLGLTEEEAEAQIVNGFLK